MTAEQMLEFVDEFRAIPIDDPATRRAMLVFRCYVDQQALYENNPKGIWLQLQSLLNQPV